jgi:DNA-directed DNA polymerase III PolC
MDFVHLHTHSEYSFYAGVPKVQELVAIARELGHKAIALTDTNRMSGLIDFYLQCKNVGIKPILGVELTAKDNQTINVVMLAKNANGYSDICEIISERHLTETFSLQHVLRDRLWENILFLSNYPEILSLLISGANRSNSFAELINNSQDSRKRSKKVEKIALENQIPMVASNNVFFLNRENWDTHKVLKAIGLNSTLSRLEKSETAPHNATYRTAREMATRFPDHWEALQNTNRIADLCNVELQLDKWILPKVAVPKGDSPESFLRKIAFEGLEKNYGSTVFFQKAKDIQEMELQVIEKLGYASYFLMVKDIRDWASEKFRTRYRKLKDCSILRGSAANSITFFNMGASDLCPIKHNLYFQRFLNEDRASPPDADLDFGWDERDQVLDYVVERWGRERVAITCTTVHFRKRASFREVAKVFGYSDEQISLISKSKDKKKFEDSEISKISQIARSIEGKPRFLGQHPGGLLITNDPIYRHVALERSGGVKNRVITQIDMHQGIDELGLIKFDLLGNGSLSVVRDTLGQIEMQGLEDPDISDLERCFADRKVKEIISKGRTRGIFYIESPAQTRLNLKAQVQTFEELTITSSLIRPAGTAYCKEFVDRHRKMKQGIRDWDYLHPSLEPLLKETHGVLAFQEDVAKVCIEIAGLNYKTADKIRKMMNSLHEGIVESKAWEEVQEAFVVGCQNHKELTKEQALELWKRVSSFTGFSFCKSHSGSYAQLSFKCTYLKAYFPAQFLSSVISNNHGFYSRETYINEARRWGIRILPMDINESRIKYYGKSDWIRPGLMHIKGLSQKGKERIFEKRENGGRFRNFGDFRNRTGLSRHELEKLILVGAFDGMGLTQPELLFALEADVQYETNGLFGPSNLHPELDDYSLTRRCFNELALLGFMLSGNILDILDLHPSSRNTVRASELEHFAGKGVKIFAWPVTERVHRVSGSKNEMMFLTVEDRTGSVDVIFWPRNYKRFASALAKPGPYVIWGKVSEDWDSYSVEAENIVPVSWNPAQIDFKLASQRLKNSFRDYEYHDISIGHVA